MKPQVALLLLFAGLSVNVSANAQNSVPRQQRRPAVDAPASPASAPAPSGQYFSILDGTPMLLALHHDTEVGTNKPVDVYDHVIELQIMNSDGNFEPVGLQIHNFYTAKPLDARNDINPHNARDCRFWNNIVVNEDRDRRPNSKTWPYIELTVAQGARIVQTNEDGAVLWSDDIQCWVARDRFSPF